MENHQEKKITKIEKSLVKPDEEIKNFRLRHIKPEEDKIDKLIKQLERLEIKNKEKERITAISETESEEESEKEIDVEKLEK